MNLLKLYEVSYYYLAHAVIVPPCAPLAPLFPSPMFSYRPRVVGIDVASTLASYPGPRVSNTEKGLVTLERIPLCAESAVLISK